MLSLDGVPRDIVTLCGIPIMPHFAELPSKSECRAQLGACMLALPLCVCVCVQKSWVRAHEGVGQHNMFTELRDDVPVIVQMSGGSDVFDIYELLLKVCVCMCVCRSDTWPTIVAYTSPPRAPPSSSSSGVSAMPGGGHHWATEGCSFQAGVLQGVSVIVVWCELYSCSGTHKC